MIEDLPFVSKLTRVLKTNTLRDTTIVFVGNLVSSVIGAVYFFILAHQSGPYVFGVFSVSIAVAITAVDLFDIAVNNAIVSFGGRDAQSGWAFRKGLQSKAIFVVLATLLLWIGAPLVVSALGRGELLEPIRIALWVIPAKALFSYVKTVLQTTKRFALDALVDVGSSVLRIGGFFIGIWAGMSVISSALWSYTAGLVVSAVLAFPALLVPSKGNVENEADHKAFAKYQGWMMLAFACSSVSSRLDVFFLTRLLSLEVVGWYQAAFRLFMPIQQLASSLSRVFAPRFAGFLSKQEVTSYLHKTVVLCGALTGSMLLLIPIFPFAVNLLYGPGFRETTTLSYGLLLYFSVFLFSTPWWSKLLYFDADARKFSLLSILQLIVLVIGIPIAISIFGVLGVALTLTVSIGIATAIAAKRK